MMETGLERAVSWQNPSPEVIYDCPRSNNFATIITINESFVQSQKLRESLFESRKAFLNISLNDEKSEDEQMEEKSIVFSQTDHKKPHSKKIGYKVKKQSSLHRRNQRNPLNKVAELTKKFNEMNESKTILEEAQIKKILNRVNSQKSVESVKVIKKPSVSRKPSVKTKPILDNSNIVIIKTVTRKSSLKKQNSDRICVRAKIGHLETLHHGEISRPTTLNVSKNVDIPIIQTSPNGTSVKATIEIFERKSVSPQTPKDIPKKLVSKTNVTDNILTVKILSPLNSSEKRNDEIEVLSPSSKESVSQINLGRICIEDDKKCTEDHIQIEKSDDLEPVQIINIPAVLPHRRCDSMYETCKKIQPEKLKAKSEEVVNRDPLKPNNSFLWKSAYAVHKPNTNANIIQASDEQIQKDEGNYTVPQLPPKPAPKCSNPSKIMKKRMPLPDEQLEDHKDHEEANKIIISQKTNNNIEGYEEIANPTEEAVYEVLKEKEESVSINAKGETNKGYEEMLKTNDKKEKLPSKMYEEISNSGSSEKIYEELSNKPPQSDDGYEPIGNKSESNHYEYCTSSKPENIYETLPQVPPRRVKQEPLPPRPASCRTYCSKNEEVISNTYESIYNREEMNYESIYNGNLTDSGSNRDSLLSSDQKSNSLYGKGAGNWEDDRSTYKAASELSCSDKSDDWIDMTDNEEEDASSGLIIVRERHKPKSTGWPQHFREQSSKASNLKCDSDSSDHHYESLYDMSAREEIRDDDYDSFASDTDSLSSFERVNNDSGVDIGHNQLPDPPNTQPYSIVKFAGKHMKKIKDFSIDIPKSLSRMTKRKSRTDITYEATKKYNEPPTVPPRPPQPIQMLQVPYQNIEYPRKGSITDESSREKTKSLPRKGFLNKFRRSMSISAESASELMSTLEQKPKSVFYLTETIDVDVERAEEVIADSGISLSPILRQNNKSIIRPNSPPPPAPTAIRRPNRKDRKASSWYAEAGVFKNSSEINQKRPNTFWYAEVGLYQPEKSLSNTSSAENSGSSNSTPYRREDFNESPFKKDDFISTEDYYNMKNESGYYNDSTGSFSSEKKDSLIDIQQDIQLRLQDEPLYQFYDAAVSESVCYDNTSDFDSDNYEEVSSECRLGSRPSAMELVSPTRTLWCEIPEVVQSAVLSTLSPHQKKLQEAKFEIITSEASYLNSLNVLIDHFVTNLSNCKYITHEQSNIIFGKIEAVRDCSESLLQDLEKCWQDNILLHRICDIVQKHAENHFYVYIPYCENQILLDDTLRQIKERPGFNELLKKLESSTACQSLTLYSFLMLPMQRITRWPLLIDAVLKRLSQQDQEYVTCQYTLASLNKIVNQCNEAARTKERETELQKVSKQLEFPSNVLPIDIVSPSRWLIKSGPITQIIARNDDTKLTFGKRFKQVPLHFFIFNDLFFVAKEKSENIFTVLHHCPRNFVELNSSELLLAVPTKEAQGKNLVFLTLLENQDGKTVEMLLSCTKESDKERWIEALTPPKSEDPDETLYECWDCPQVSAKHNYVASQPDELGLCRGDVINVLRKMADGWYHGERIRDGQQGWFPANHCTEIANPHVRARNLKQRYRLLAFSENYLKSK